MGRIVVIGPKPPPTHGYAVITESAANKLREKYKVYYLKSNVKGNGVISRNLGGFILFVFNALMLVVLRLSGARVLYAGVNAGFGQIYNLLHFCLASFLGMRIAAHHHSYVYINSFNKITSIILSHKFRNVTHITLNNKMSMDMISLYGKGSYIDISNSAFVDPEARKERTESTKNRSVVIGLLGNLDKEKGLHDFLSLARDFKREGIDCKFILAGPVRLDADKKLIHVAQNEKLIEYRGATYGEQKDDFLSEVDIFVFPTRYKHEAQPTVIFEAYRSETLFMSLSRGVIRETILSDGYVFNDMDSLKVKLVEEVKRFLENPTELHEAQNTVKQINKKNHARESERFLHEIEKLFL